MLFTCPNSSFRECLRKHSNKLHQHNNYNVSTNTPSCLEENTQNGRCKYTQRPTLPTSDSLLFNHTDFSECSNDDLGGAIYLSFEELTQISLSINDSTFTNCYCEDPSSNQFGDSMYAYNISFLSATHSFLAWSSTDNQQAFHGGAMYLYNIPSVTIHDDTFTMCYSQSYA